MKTLVNVHTVTHPLRSYSGESLETVTQIPSGHNTKPIYAHIILSLHVSHRLAQNPYSFELKDIANSNSKQRL